MATYKVRDPQGNIREISGPDGASDADVIAQAQKLFSTKPAPLEQIEVNGPQPESMGPMEALGGLAMGGLKGASRIGNIIVGTVMGDRAEREKSIDQFMGDRADTDSALFKIGDIGAQVAGTAGVGGVFGKAASKVPQAAKYAELLRSGGFSLGPAATNSALANALLRGGSGALTGGAATAMVSPEDAGTGAMIGGATPLAVQGAAKVGQAIGGGPTHVILARIHTSASVWQIERGRTIAGTERRA